MRASNSIEANYVHNKLYFYRAANPVCYNYV